ncbi:hypothetical protein BCh11DRAFT_06364 [Burkholderia sp. Ch1-1]|uniref:Uncharacterized protein n=1 Tax=Paraburkholderia dioscoreae TaxID=2604047 RepID=A0A5Q4ZDS8_9BURK|nr:MULTISPECIES: hypothetical protein [Paraburkholderia]EIF30855.1 hypothetical protein BCh11DRAFT_06364 [Burkholderia sp. Ch1-1]MDR8398485.1 hypothetical protein [Paraburkholderia sp. USG1]VVD28903.1 conserved protein of unknown function [Paraburkholderia dioscoreae]
MKDAYERRALLLHLGDVLEAVNRLMICSGDKQGKQTVHEAVAAHDSLKGVPLLMHVSPSMATRDFVEHATAAFLSWPRELLELELDREQLARTVQQALFADNAQGWQDYVVRLREAVAWFGADLKPIETSQRPGEVVTRADTEQPDPLARDADTGRPDSGDIERDNGDQSQASRESVENGGRLYPSWPWKSGV